MLITRHFLTLLTYGGLLIGSHEVMAIDKTFYRYINAEGNVVINSSLPPEFAQKGYEVVNAHGQILRVVAPAMSEAEKARMEQEQIEAQRLQEWDEHLLRRYSSVKDIEAAKERKLATIANNIAILKSNLHSTNNQIANMQAEAANFERVGKAVPQSILDNLQTLEDELKSTEESMEKRYQEQQELSDRFDEDIERFNIIRPEAP